MDWNISVDAAFTGLPADADDTYPEGVPFRPVMRHGTMTPSPSRRKSRTADFTDDFRTWVIFWGPDRGEEA